MCTIITPAYYHIPIIKQAPRKVIRFRKLKLNLFHLTCSCEKYQELSAQYPPRDLNRLCIHLYTMIHLLRDYNDSITNLMIDTHFWFGRQQLYKVEKKGAVFYLGFIPEKGIHVLYRYGKEWDRIIYDCKTRKWDKKQSRVERLFWEEHIKKVSIIKTEVNEMAK